MANSPVSDPRSIDNLTRCFQMPRIGKIRLGVRVDTGKGTAPKEVPHFVVPPEVERVFGPQPTSLLIMFPLNDLKEIFPTENVWYGTGTGKKCYSTPDPDKKDALQGHCLWTHVEATGNPQPPQPEDPNQRIIVPCPCPLIKNKTCTPKGLLRFMLPQISVSGVYEIGTPSVANIVRIKSALTLLYNIFERWTGIPITLTREPVKMQWQGALRTHYLLSLKFEGDLQAVHAIRNSTTISIPALPATPAPPPPAEPPAAPITIQATATPAPVNGTSTEPIRSSPAPTPPGPPPKEAPTPAASSAPPTKPVPRETPQCRCGRTVTTAVAEYSRRLFQEVLCIPCQKTYGASGQPPAAA